MKYFVAVPSKNRVETLKKFTLSWLSLIDTIPWYIFVEPQDYEAYLEIVPKNHLIQIDDNNRGLSYSKQFIRVWGEKQGFEVVYKIDDDVKGWTNKRLTHKTPELNAEQFWKNHTHISQLFTTFPTVGAVAFPYSNEFYDENVDMFTKTKRLQSCYVIKLKLLYNDITLGLFEDFTNGIYVLLNNYKIARFNNSGISLGVRVGKGAGGVQSFNRTEKEAMASIDTIRKLYPPLKAKKVDKPWKIEPDIRSVKL